MQDIVPHQDFYVYFLYRSPKPGTPRRIIQPNGMVVFYVGKGRKNRIGNHEICARNKETCRHVPCRVIRKVLAEGGHIAKEKIAEGLPEAAAFRVEKVMIAYGRASLWPLVNLSNGGDPGPTGSKRTAEQLEAQSQRTKEYMLANPVRRNLIGDLMRGRKMTPEENETFHQKLKDLYASNPELVERQRQHQLQRWENNPQERERYRIITTESIAKAAQANIDNTYNAKTWGGFRSPSGEIFTDLFNLAEFCEEHGLDDTRMASVYHGVRISHKGWTRYPPLERETKPTYAKAGFRDPQGTIYQAEDIPNLSEFCRKYALQRTCMAQVGNGQLHSHKGWMRYPELKAERDYHGTYTGPALLSPEGRIFSPQEIDNLTAFCSIHHLQPSNMSLVAQGKQVAHKGWTQYPPLSKPPKFSFKSPDGTIYHAANLHELCKTYGLNESCMSLLHAGKLHAHQGWTRYEPEVQPVQGRLF